MGLIWGSLAPSPRPRLLGFTKTPVCTRNRKSISTTRIWNHNDGTADCSNMNLPLHCLLFCFRFCCISQFYAIAVDRCRKDLAFAFSFSKSAMSFAKTICTSLHNFKYHVEISKPRTFALFFPSYNCTIKRSKTEHGQQNFFGQLFILLIYKKNSIYF